MQKTQIICKKGISLEPRDHVVFGAFLHDIGKLYERAEELSDYAKDESKQQEYCPYQNKGGYYSHRHTLYTLAFCETLESFASIFKQKFGSDDHWINIASRHHKPSTLLEHIVSKADRLASGEREGSGIYEKDIHKKTHLESLLEKVSLTGKRKKTKYRFPLKPLDKGLQNLFPKQFNDFSPPLIGENLLSPEKLTKDYKDLAKGLLKAIENFPEYKDSNFESLRSACSTLLSQFERFLISVPSATNVSSPDISLFDHLKMTAAIAEGLYLYHDHYNTLTIEDLGKDKREKKWLLVCGDFSGIQKFIYSVVSKGAGKSLAGRSLYIQLLCSAVSEWLLRELKLYPTSCIYSSGGKFYLLIANQIKDNLKEKTNEINRLLFEEYKGRIHLDLEAVDLCEEDFYSNSMSEKFKEVNEVLLKNRPKKFFPLIKENPQKFFEPQTAGDKICCICGSDDKESFNERGTALTAEEDSQAKCISCEKFENMGSSFRKPIRENENAKEPGADLKRGGLLWLWSEGDYHNVKNAIKKSNEEVKFFDIFFKKPYEDPGKSHLDREENQESSKDEDSKGTGNQNDHPFLKICRLGPEHLEKIKNLHLKNSHFEFVNCIEDVQKTKGLSFGHRSIAFCDKLDLDKMADKAEGIRRIGILRMDVDNLGHIFVKGLNFKEDLTGGGQSDGQEQKQKKLGSLSRQAALSRSINSFFTAYLTDLAENSFKNCKIIYAGGDDLFAVGPWNELPELAFEIRKKFKEYCCGNPDLTLSAGIALITEKYPLLGGAFSAGEAEEKAKSFDRGEASYLSTQEFSKKQNEKDALCFLDTVIGWEEYEEIKDFKKNLEELMNETKSKSLLQILYHIDKEVKQERGRNSGICYKPWRSRFVYCIARLIERHKGDENIKHLIDKLKSDILNEPQDEDPDFNSNHKKSLEKNGNPIERNGFLEKNGGEDSEKEDHPPHWLFMPIRWVDYLQREGEKKDNRKAG